MKNLYFSVPLVFFCILISAQSSTEKIPLLYSIEPVLNLGKIVENSPMAPSSRVTMFSEINFAIQTDGRRDWHQFYNFPKPGILLAFGGLGNRKELGHFIGLVPNMTINTRSRKWYLPQLAGGLGIAYFTNPYNAQNNATNFYIGSSITAMGYASVYFQPELNRYLSLKTGLSVVHFSNGHVQIPNLGINLPTISLGLTYRPNAFPLKFEKRTIETPKSKLQLNVRLGIGVHQLARTTEPIGIAKYAVYVTDFYVSRRFGKISNVHLGVEINHYNSYYHFINEYGLYSEKQNQRASVITVFLGHEFMIGHFSLLSQGGINVYNPFYKKYIDLYIPSQNFHTELKRYISTRLGLQYYLWEPKYNTRTNIFIGAYIKANFGQADFVCSQIGFVF